MDINDIHINKQTRAYANRLVWGATVYEINYLSHEPASASLPTIDYYWFEGIGCCIP